MIELEKQLNNISVVIHVQVLAVRSCQAHSSFYHQFLRDVDRP